MARQTVTTLIDDIDGSEANETVLFGLDGSSYEVDLNDAHAEDLREILAPYVSVARRAGARGPRLVGGPRRSTSPGGSAGEVDPKAVRAWAKANGVEINARGRLKADVVDKYRAATG